MNRAFRVAVDVGAYDSAYVERCLGEGQQWIFFPQPEARA